MIVIPNVKIDGTVVLKITENSLDRSNVAEFKAEAVKALSTASGNVEVDCDQLDFIDSSGLGAFLHVNNLLSEDRRPLGLTAVGPKVLTVLELMQVHRIFRLEPKHRK